MIPQYLAFYHWRSRSHSGVLANSVTGEIGRHKFYRQMLLNQWLRADLAAGRFGIGTYANLRGHIEMFARQAEEREAAPPAAPAVAPAAPRARRYAHAQPANRRIPARSAWSSRAPASRAARAPAGARRAARFAADQIMGRKTPMNRLQIAPRYVWGAIVGALLGAIVSSGAPSPRRRPVCGSAPRRLWACALLGGWRERPTAYLRASCSSALRPGNCHVVMSSPHDRGRRGRCSARARVVHAEPELQHHGRVVLRARDLRGVSHRAQTRATVPPQHEPGRRRVTVRRRRWRCRRWS